MFIAHSPLFEKNLQLLSVFIKKKRLLGLLWIALSAVWILLPGRSWSSLQFVEARYGGPVLDGAYGLAASPDGKHLYAAGYYDGVIAVFSRNTGTGSLSFAQVQYGDTAGVDGLFGARSVVVSPDGAHVYAAGEYDNAVGVFDRDGISGQLSFVEVQQNQYDGAEGLYGVEDVTVSPDGYHLYAAGSHDSAIAVFNVDSDNDGQPNATDPFPFDPTETEDTDNDGIGDHADTDDDDDGVSDTVEDGGPAAGDGNGDGLPDRLQGNVATLVTYDNAYYVTLAAPGGMMLSNCRAMANPSPSDAPQDVVFTYGFFQFTLNGISVGGGATLTMHLPSGAAPAAYYKYGPTPDNTGEHWYSFANDNETGVQINQNTVTLNFVDGRRGDDVLVADGMIVDIGAPAFEKAASGSSSGSSGGGCFLSCAF
jgi:hypothetical protein